MKIVDKQIFDNDPNMSLKEQEEAFKERMKKRYEQRLKSTDLYRIRAERATKLSDMRQFMFGEHLVKVPVLHEDLFFDIPSPDSSAMPFKEEYITTPVPVKERKYGQILEGDMIPQRECQMAESNAKTKGAGKKLFSAGKKAGGVAKDAPVKAIGSAFKAAKKLGDTGKEMTVPLLQQQDSSDSDDGSASETKKAEAAKVAATK